MAETNPAPASDVGELERDIAELERLAERSTQGEWSRASADYQLHNDDVQDYIVALANKALPLIRRLQSEVARLRGERAADEIGWLIESEDAEGAPVWFTLAPGEFEWIKDSVKALRFARREDADAYAGLYLDSDGPPCRITEHMWTVPPAPPSGSKLIDGLRDAVAGNFARVTIDGQVWERVKPSPEAAPEGKVEPVAWDAWAIGNGDGTRWRTWTDMGPDWTEDQREALWFARREDAEKFAADDEDAWTITRISLASPPTDRARGLLKRLAPVARLLYANSLACVEQHHGRDTEANGLPGWLDDCRPDIEAATAFLASPDLPGE